MNIDIPELADISAKLDKILMLLEDQPGRANWTGVHRRLLNTNEVSEYIGISTATVRQWCSSKRIPHVKLGGRVMFDLEDIDPWIEGKKAKTLRR